MCKVPTSLSLNGPVSPQPAAQADRRAAVQNYLAANPGAQAIDVAAALGCTETEALRILSDAVWEIPAAHLMRVLAEIKAWGRAMVLVRNRDAVAEVEVPADGGQVSGDWLNWIAEDYNLHLRIAAAQRILALVRSGKRGPTYSFNLAVPLN